MIEGNDWRPTALLDAIRLRATLLARIRAYFAAQDVLEVDTPALSRAATTDPTIESFRTTFHGPGPTSGKTLFLHTSPEFPMKRLLAAGTGSIYQVSKVFRNGEFGQNHNPEFTLLEWYRVGFDYFDLMDDVERLLASILRDVMPLDAVEHWTYRDLFVEFTGIDPFDTSIQDIRRMLELEHALVPVGMAQDQLDSWLDLALTHVIEPRLGSGLIFVRDYPATQSALARIRPGTPPVAARFEAYLGGVELANGFHELADAMELQQRLERENEMRRQQGAEPVTVDQSLLAALAAGFPDCAGVALGVDRLLMLACRAQTLEEVIAFPLERA